MSASPEPLVIFTPSGRRGHFPDGTTVLDAGRALGVDIDSVCGGRGLCGRCAVTPAAGSFPKHGIESSPGHLSAEGPLETEYRDARGLAADRRLSCTAELHGDVLIDVPPESQVHRQVVRKGLDVREFAVDPVVRLYYVVVRPADLARPDGDLARLNEALAAEWSLEGLEADLGVIRDLQPALEQDGGSITVAVHDGRSIIGVWPGLHDKAYGVAIDVGSTTLAGHLADLASGAVLASSGVMNPQIRFGEDSMSRISYAMLHDGGAAEMTKAVRDALTSLIAGLASAGGIDGADILELTVVGNPTMHHLLLGIDPVPLGSAPFALATDRAVRATAAELSIDGVHPDARVYVLPCIAGHVGADTAGVILADEAQRATRVRATVDVGTNAEIVVGTKDRLLAASSPTGPAFEGAQISSGQRAAPGAIERVRIDRDTLEPRFRVIGSPRWSDEPGFDTVERRLGVTGICGSGIVEAIAELFLAGVITPDGIVDGSLAARTARVIPDGRTFSYLLHQPAEAGGPRVVITQNDVRAIQLAKAALYAGIRLLMDHLGVDEVEEIRLAGAFGSQIDLLHAMVLGLIPDCDLAAASPAGNAAGTGALIALLSGAARKEIEEVVRRVEKIETAVEPRFQEHFVEAMAFPHRTAPYPHLRAAVELPTARSITDDGPGGRAERRRRRAVAAGTREGR
jgi:uncharacterized 2Fe-2S/4Fe-4S cluster protein (DUF4445 family)